MHYSSRPAVPYVLADAAQKHELVFEVDPRQIATYLNKFIWVDGRKYLAADWFVIPGDWGVQLVEETPVYRCMKELIATGDDFKQTASYREALDRLLMHGPHMHNGRYLEGVGDVENYFGKYLDIITTMRDKGFQDSRAADQRDSHIGVAVGPNGKLFHFRKGHHRFAISRELCITSIPVKVLAIHSDYLNECMTAKYPTPKTLAEGLQRRFREIGHEDQKIRGNKTLFR